MARFQFSLQTVLEIREREEQARQSALAQLQQAMVQLEQRLAELDGTARRNRQELRDAHLTGPINVDVIGAYTRFHFQAERQAMGLARQMQGLQQKIDAARALLVEAVKGRRVLEKLRDNQRAAWVAEQQRKEQAALDDVAQSMVLRARRKAQQEVTRQQVAEQRADV
jgi:flagellar protein FliJ